MDGLTKRAVIRILVDPFLDVEFLQSGLHGFLDIDRQAPLFRELGAVRGLGIKLLRAAPLYERPPGIGTVRDPSGPERTASTMRSRSQPEGQGGQL